MNWQQVRTSLPNKWIIVEATRSRHEGKHYVVDDVTIVETCDSGAEAIEIYRRLHQLTPQRDLIFIHTSQQELKLEERHWAGVRVGS